MVIATKYTAGYRLYSRRKDPLQSNFAGNSAKNARANGLTPFSVYQGQRNVSLRDTEAEIIPMCEDQGMAVVSWANLGGGQLLTSEQREKLEKDPDARPNFYENSPIANL
ncbi:Norsolorinic acid reductase [Colletotrichum tanaceti]|uniref:Norsolorinic acid reductase n=1 Tax=Colletotrichum tanaceti TaxID=1306861 RepID=A0A4U6X501_9PEZI|nr:Norsolorinic acid reductase [Colletotrichum tanaceti]